VADAEGHVALAPLAAGQPVLSSAITAEAFTGIAARVPVGYRAYSIAVSEADIAGGFLQAGDRVDLYVTLPGALFGSMPGGFVRAADQSRSTLLLQGVDILAVGTSRKSDGTADTAARTVTLALNSDALSKVALAARLGRVSFAIRNPGDRQAAHKEVADLDTLVAAHPQAVAAREPRALPATTGITIYAGRAQSVVRVP
jgi:pilus assembly protein CpaB